jgi:hypothetical protein
MALRTWIIYFRTKASTATVRPLDCSPLGTPDRLLALVDSSRGHPLIGMRVRSSRRDDAPAHGVTGASLRSLQTRLVKVVALRAVAKRRGACGGARPGRFPGYVSLNDVDVFPGRHPREDVVDVRSADS